MRTVVLDPDEIEKKTKTVISQSKLANQLGTVPAQTTTSTTVAPSQEKTVFTTAAEQKVAQAACSVIKKFESQPDRVPTTHSLANAEVQADMVREVAAAITPIQLELEGVTEQPDIAAIVKKTAELVVQQTIDIPRILVVPKGEVESAFNAFELDLTGLNFQPISDELWVQLLRTGTHEVIGLGKGGLKEKRLENCVVSGLEDFDDIDHKKHADLLYDLASQTVTHLRGYLSEEQVGKVLWRRQKEIAGFIHAQMQVHYWEDEAVEYEVVISKGFTELKSSAYTAAANEEPLDFRVSPKDKSNMAKYLFGGFKRCLYPVQKFDSEAERILAVIMDRETAKWFKPAKGLFQIFYRLGADHPEYQPDFVAETAGAIYMLEPKKRTALKDADVAAKKDAAENWCENATSYSLKHGGKPWIYRLIPHDTITKTCRLTTSGRGSARPISWSSGFQGNPAAIHS